jgi:hypothetical protein
MFEDNWIDDNEPPIEIERNNPLINIVNNYRHEATEHKSLPTFNGNKQHYKTFRKSSHHFEMNWRKFFLLACQRVENVTDEDKIEAMQNIYEHMMEVLEQHRRTSTESILQSRKLRY